MQHFAVLYRAHLEEVMREVAAEKPAGYMETVRSKPAIALRLREERLTTAQREIRLRR